MTHNEQHNCEANLFGGGFLSLKDVQPADPVRGCTGMDFCALNL